MTSFRRMVCCACVVLFAVAAGARGQDLTKIDKKLQKEPAYAGEKRWYALLVFGPKADTRVWLVHDPGKDWHDPKDDVLYVDRNGNGDLTEPGEKVSATVRTSEMLVTFLKKVVTNRLPGFHVGKITEADGKTQHTDLTLLSHGYAGDRPRYTVSVKVYGQYLQTTSGGTLRFGATPQEAPVIHFNGPLTLHLDMWSGTSFVPSDGTPPLDEQKTLTPGKTGTLTALLGCKGLGAGTFAAFAANYPPEGVHPVAEIAFPHKDAAQPPIKARADLTLPCCAVKFSGPVDVPIAAAAGKAQVKLSMTGWTGRVIAPAEFAVSVAPPGAP